jgi:hypothetical protein
MFGRGLLHELLPRQSCRLGVDVTMRASNHSMAFNAAPGTVLLGSADARDSSGSDGHGDTPCSSCRCAVRGAEDEIPADGRLGRL